MSATFSFVSYTISGPNNYLLPTSAQYNGDPHVRSYKASYGAMSLLVKKKKKEKMQN
jgi:hypothetical protein